MALLKPKRVILSGLAADRPAASSVAEGALYLSTDAAVVERSNGSIWSTWAAGVPPINSYTPTWSSVGTPPVLNDGTLTGNYTRTPSGLIWFNIHLVMGASTTYGTGAWTFTPPVAARDNRILVWAIGRDVSVGPRYSGFTEGDLVAGLITITPPIAGYTPGTVSFRFDTPFVWAAGDYLHIEGTYLED